MLWQSRWIMQVPANIPVVSSQPANIAVTLDIDLNPPQNGNTITDHMQNIRQPLLVMRCSSKLRFSAHPSQITVPVQCGHPVTAVTEGAILPRLLTHRCRLQRLANRWTICHRSGYRCGRTTHAAARNGLLIHIQSALSRETPIRHLEAFDKHAFRSKCTISVGSPQHVNL